MNQADPGLAAVPGTHRPVGSTEESRAFLQHRLMLVTLLCASLSAFFLIVTSALSWVEWEQRTSAHRYTDMPGFYFHLAATLIPAAIWVFLRRGPRREQLLIGIDYTSSLVISVLLTLMGVTMDVPEGMIQTLLALILILMVRAVVVPSTGRRTLFVSGVASLFATVTVAVAVHAPWISWLLGRVNSVQYILNFALWLTATTVVATIASRIIFGLQEQIRHARQIGAYVLDEKIGEGGMGVVYRATHGLLRRETAIKMLLPGRMAPTAVARFEREVHQLARLNHPNTIAIYDYGRTPDGVFYYAMEYVDGLDLEDLVEAIGPLPPGRVVHLLIQICESLAEAHDLGLVHRDIKPANVLVGQRGGIPDFVKVLDFGLVKDLGSKDGVTLTQAERFIGTPLYAAPEAINGPDGATFASDLYATGAVGYYALTGTHLVQRQAFIDVCALHLYGTPEAPSQRLGRPLPLMLEALILQALEKSAEDRPASARQFARSLRACTDVAPWSEQEAREWWAEVGCALVRRKSRLEA